MKDKRRFIRILSVVTVFMILMIGLEPMQVFGTETGMVVELSEKVYESMNTDSRVVANVIAGSPFSVLSETSDETGRMWYHIRTDTGKEGYILTDNVAVAGQERAGGANTQASQQEVSQDEGAQEVNAGEADIQGEAAEGQAAGNLGNRDEQTQREGTAGGDVENEGESATGPEHGTGTSLQVRTLGVVNMRREPSIGAQVLATIPQNTILNCDNGEENEAGEVWYNIIYNGAEGYVRDSTVEVIQESFTEGVADPVNPDRIGDEEDMENNEGEGAESVVEGGTDLGGIDDDGDKEKDDEQQEEKPTAKQRTERMRLFLDWVSIGAFAGCIVCVVIALRLAKQFVRVYHGRKERKKRKKECSPKKRKRYT